MCAACAGEQPKHLGALAGQAALGAATTPTTAGAVAAATGGPVEGSVPGTSSGAANGSAAGSATGGSAAPPAVAASGRAAALSAAGASGTGAPAGSRNPAGSGSGPSASGSKAAGPSAPGAPAVGGASAAAPAQGNGGATDVGVTADSIKLGGFFIESGPVGELGITLLKAVKSVFNEVNAQGGLYGRKLQLVDCDTSFTSGDKPRACYTKLTQQDKIFSFAATGDGPAWVTAAPLACKDQIPALWTDGLSQNEFVCPTIFPTGPAGRSQSRVVLDYYVKNKHPKTVGILAQNDDIGNEWLVGAKEVLGKTGVKIVAEEKYNLGETNFTTQVTNMRFANPDFVFFSSEPLGPILFQKTAEGQGWKPPLPSAGVTCNVSVWPRQVGDYAKGMICQNPWQLLSARLPGQVEFERNYKKYWSDWDKRNYYTETMWIAARATVETLRRAGPNLTRARLLEVLRSGAFNGFDTGFGVKFSQQSSAKGNLFSINVAVVEVAKPADDNPYVLVQEPIPDPFFQAG
ncbi:MAG: branched-chain amino acid transport system substrate-binding protein [Actinomycetota bacterium]|nr:branched-chain amino acid transport system substrate-binding protein [Actinomycetota bacterium]